MLKHVDNALKKDRDVVLAAVKQNGCAFQFAHEDFKKDKALVIEVVNQDGGALKFAHEALKKDPEVVLLAVKENRWVLKHVHKDLQKDQDVMRTAIEHRESPFDLSLTVRACFFGFSQLNRGPVNIDNKDYQLF